MRLHGESLVFIGEEPSPLALPPAARANLRLRSTYLSGPDTVHYQAGRDYRFDAKAGALTRLPGSRLPDFRTNILFGRCCFDHTLFPGYGNTAFFAYADYTTDGDIAWPPIERAAAGLANTRSKLARGAPLTVVAFGDSITHGGEASAPELIFWQRWLADLQRKHPQTNLRAINGATGGDSTTQGLQRLDEKVLRAKPDLVLVGFGMNDHNRGSVSLPRFRRQLREIVTRIQDAGAEVILYSAFPPNPGWRYGAQRMEAYARITHEVATSAGCAYGNVFAAWQVIAARKRPEDLLANNINHPNDFGHWIYYQTLAATGLQQNLSSTTRLVSRNT